LVKITQLKNRSSFYLVVPVLSQLRKVIRPSNITKKAGATKAEATRHRTRLLMEIEQRFRDAYANDPVLNAYEQVERSGGEIAEALEENLKAAGYSQREVETALYGAEALKEQDLEPAPIGKLEAALEAARTGS
jgi:hypothetical protein